MRTLVRVENANCQHCLSAVRDELLARPRVAAVRMSAVAGCLEVDHDHDDPTAIGALLEESLHGWQVAGNGEVVSVRTTAEIADTCSWHGGGVGPPSS